MTPTERFVPILVEPKYEGNIGAIARSSKNFGVRRLVIVNGPSLGEEARKYSMHGYDLIENAIFVKSFKEALEEVDHCVGTSGISGSAEKAYLRNPMGPEGMVRWSRTVKGEIGLAMGREDFGLSREEMELCDVMVTIPANPEYPILNLSHAAAVLLYEIWKGSSSLPNRNARMASREERGLLLDHYDRLMAVSDVPEHKRIISSVHFRRMMARAAPNVREFYSLMGTFSRAMDYKRDRSPYQFGETSEE